MGSIITEMASHLGQADVCKKDPTMIGQPLVTVRGYPAACQSWQERVARARLDDVWFTVFCIQQCPLQAVWGNMLWCCWASWPAVETTYAGLKANIFTNHVCICQKFITIYKVRKHVETGYNWIYTMIRCVGLSKIADMWAQWLHAYLVCMT